MRTVKSAITKALPSGARLDVVDNTGARIIEIISVKGSKTTRMRIPSGGIGDMVIASVKRGSPEMKKQMVKAVIVRQRKEYRRPDGMRVKFEDNAAVITNDDGEPKGSDIKGPVAKEAAERWSKIASTASIII